MSEEVVNPCIDCGESTYHEFFMVTEEVWAAAKLSEPADQYERQEQFLCVPCLEKRLGRELSPDDFSEWSKPEKVTSERLRKRMGDRKFRKPTTTAWAGKYD